MTTPGRLPGGRKSRLLQAGNPIPSGAIYHHLENVCMTIPLRWGPDRGRGERDLSEQGNYENTRTRILPTAMRRISKLGNRSAVRTRYSVLCTEYWWPCVALEYASGR